MGIERTGLDILIRTPADLAGARAVEEQLQRTILKAGLLGEKFDEDAQKLSRVQAQIAAAEGQGGGRGLNPLGAGLRGVANKGAAGATADAAALGTAGFAAASAAAAAAAAVVQKSIAEFVQAQQAVVALDTALAQQGLLTDEYRVKLQELAGQLEQTTAIADEKWLGVLTKLSQAGFDSAVIDQSTETVKNLAGAMGVDIEQAAGIFIKAMQGNTDGLRRYGIVVEETSDRTERFKRISEEAATRGGGQLEARAKTLGGQLDSLKIAWGNVFENTGKWLGQNVAVQGGIEFTRGAFAGLALLLDRNIDGMDGLKNAAGNAATGFDRIKDASGEAAAKVDADVQKEIAAVNKFTEALRRQNDVRAGLNDDQLAGELAAIDIEEANAPDDPVAKAQRETRRNGSRRRAEIRSGEGALQTAQQTENALKFKLGQLPEGEERDALLEQFNNANAQTTLARSRLNTRSGIVARAGEAKDARAESDALAKRLEEQNKTKLDLMKQIFAATEKGNASEIALLREQLKRQSGPR